MSSMRKVIPLLKNKRDLNLLRGRGVTEALAEALGTASIIATANVNKTFVTERYFTVSMFDTLEASLSLQDTLSRSLQVGDDW